MKTINKETLTMHLIVNDGMDKAAAISTVDSIFNLMRQTLLDEGKIVIPKVGTLAMCVIPAKKIKVFGDLRDFPVRYKVKFKQSPSLSLEKSPLKPSDRGDEISALADLLSGSAK